MVKNNYYDRSYLQTVVREIRQLQLSDKQIRVAKQTPFWLLINAIRTEDEWFLVNSTKKYEEDICSIIKTFDPTHLSFRFGGRIVSID